MKTTRLTTYWTVGEAATVFELLDILRDALWDTYGEQIIRMHREDHDNCFWDNNQYEFEFDDDIPF